MIGKRRHEHVRTTLWAVTALALALASCASPAPTVASTRPSASPSATGHRAAAYAVVASVLHVKGWRLPVACNVIVSSAPPTGCSGVPVAGYDLRDLPGVAVTRGTWLTPPLVLVGTWNGHVLTLTRPPVPGTAKQAPSPPAACVGPPTPAGRRLVQRMTRPNAAVHALIVSPCGSRVWVLVPVADRATVLGIRERFGDRVLVAGWLRKVPGTARPPSA